MAKKKIAQEFKLGDMVKIRHSNYNRAKIVELRGPLGPGGVEVYSVVVHRNSKPVYIELLGDQLVLLPEEALCLPIVGKYPEALPRIDKDKAVDYAAILR